MLFIYLFGPFVRDVIVHTKERAKGVFGVIIFDQPIDLLNIKNKYKEGEERESLAPDKP